MDVDQASALRVPLVTPGTRPDLAPLELRIRAERGRISLLYQVLLNSAPIAAGSAPATAWIVPSSAISPITT